MDWKLFATTFAAIFIAELGDKTQLATLTFAAGAPSKWLIFAAAAGALVLSSAIAVLAGEALSRLIPPLWIHRGAGVLFIVIGGFYLFGKGD